MEIFEKIVKLLNEYVVCDMCLGRCLANLLTGYENDERGKAIRMFICMLVDAKKIKIKKENFWNVKLKNFENVKIKKCEICNGIFEKNFIDLIVEKIIEKIKREKIEFETFEVGCKLPENILEKDEKLKRIFEYHESIKKNFNRVVGKKLEKLFEKRYEKNGELQILIDLTTKKIVLRTKSIFIFGFYKKLKRGIPQAKWILKNGTKKYRTSIQEMIEKIVLKKFKAEKIKLSIAGREDVDVRCLDWRPFVLEIVNPKIRKVDIKLLENMINSKYSSIKVKFERFSNRKEAAILKQMKIDKTYKAIVTFRQKIDERKVEKLKILEKTEIKQRTPLRVLHRRSDRIRIRKVKNIEWKILSSKKLELIITAESGLYIKELIHGDNGRTKPNIAEILENEPAKILLDVIKIHFKKLSLN